MPVAPAIWRATFDIIWSNSCFCSSTSCLSSASRSRALSCSLCCVVRSIAVFIIVCLPPNMAAMCRTATTRAREGPLFVPYLIIILAGNHMPFARTFSLATPHIRTRHYQKGINTGVNSNWHALARFHPAANRCKEHSSRVGRNYFIYYYFIIILFYL